MFQNGQCPKCERKISEVTVENITINGGDHDYKGVSYICPFCFSVLTVSMDQLSLNADLVNRLLKALGRG